MYRPAAFLMSAFALLASVAVSVAAPTTYVLNTDDHPTVSIFSLTLGFDQTAFADTLGPTAVHGTVTAKLDLSEPNDDGTVEITDANLLLDNISKNLNLGPFGNMTVGFQDVVFTILTSPASVTNNVYTITNTNTGHFGFVGGALVLSNATGFLGSALGSNPADIAFSVGDPTFADFVDLPAPITGITDDDSGSFDADGAEFKFPFSVKIDVGSGLYLILSGDINAGSAVVPEASTLVLSGLGTLGFIGAALRRRRAS